MKFLIWLGLRCPKCHGKVVYNRGWDRMNCEDCGERI